MPYYCFTTGAGETVERNFPMGSVPPSIRVGRHVARRDYAAENVNGTVKEATASRRGRGRGTWPMEPCCASGVHASQAQELRDHLKERGVPTEVTKDGDPIYTSPQHRRKALKVRGLHDKNSFD